MQWVWDHSKSRGAQRLVLLAIADNAADDGTHAYPSNATLMRKAALSERAVRTAMRELEALGELRCELNGGKRGTNMYSVIMDGKGADSAPRPNGGGAESAGVGGQNLPGGGAESAPEPSLNHPENRPSGDADATPNAGHLVKVLVDWLSERNVRLSLSQKSRYGKAFREALASGYEVDLIRAAIGEMYRQGRISQPQLLEHVLIDVQTGQQAASKSFRRQDAEDKATETQRKQARALRVDQLLEQHPGMDVRAAMAQAEAEIATHLAQTEVASSSVQAYSEIVILPEDQKEVTGS